MKVRSLDGASSSPQPPRYVFDTSALIQLERSRSLRHLPPPGNKLIVPSRVAKEATKTKKEVPATFKARAKRPKKWLDGGKVANFVTGSEHELFLSLRQQERFLTDADIQGIVIAHQRKGAYVVEEQAAKRVAEGLGVRCLKTQEFLREVIPSLPLEL